MRQFQKLYMASLRIDEKWTRPLLSCMSLLLKLSLMPYAESDFPQHIKKQEKNIEKLNGGQKSKKQHYLCKEVDATPTTKSP